jgi:hypothetical protein
MLEGDFTGMRLSRLALLSAALGAALALSAMLAPQPASAAGLAGLGATQAGIGTGGKLEHRILHGHAKRGTSFYCYPRNYWWFYRPYTTAAQGYARCMPYFHYPPEALRGRRAPYGVK